MMKVARQTAYFLFLFVALTALALGAITPVLAASANPDSIILHTVKVFQNVWETGDVLFIASYDVEYGYDADAAPGRTPEPDEPAEDTFSLAVYDTDGTTLIKSRPLNYYQYNVHSVYFDVTQTAADLTWGSAYKVRVMGNPSFFPMTEGTTMDTTSLSTWHWVEGAATETEDLLRLHCLDLAATLESEWNSVLIITTPERQVLNSTGRTVFLDAVPGFDSAVPDLFQIAASAITTTRQERTAAYEEELTVESQLGTAIKNSFDGFGEFIGISGGMVAAMWIMLFMMVVGSIVFLNSGNTTAALLLTIPIALLGVWVGAIPMAALFTAGVVIVVYMAYHVFLKGM